MTSTFWSMPSGRTHPNHTLHRDWLAGVTSSESAFGLSDNVLSGFLRIVTHPRIFKPPTPMENALLFVAALRSQPNCILIAPGTRHWPIFTTLCQANDIRGNLVPGAYLAALAIESGSEFISTDRDFSRFAGLRWHPPC